MDIFSKITQDDCKKMSEPSTGQFAISWYVLFIFTSRDLCFLVIFRIFVLLTKSEIVHFWHGSWSLISPNSRASLAASPQKVFLLCTFSSALSLELALWRISWFCQQVRRILLVADITRALDVSHVCSVSSRSSVEFLCSGACEYFFASSGVSSF